MGQHSVKETSLLLHLRSSERAVTSPRHSVLFLQRIALEYKWWNITVEVLFCGMKQLGTWQPVKCVCVCVCVCV